MPVDGCCFRSGLFWVIRATVAATRAVRSEPTLREFFYLPLRGFEGAQKALHENGAQTGNIGGEEEQKQMSRGTGKNGLTGNAVFAQSGGPTAVINASIGGAVLEAGKHPGTFRKLYGAKNGILGVLREELFDLRKEDEQSIKGLRYTPAAALGSCRYKVKKSEDYERILEVFKAHNIRFFFYAGGNDSMDTADKVARLAAASGYEMRAVGIPKTIDNDLACTDHCPGFGSAAKYNATMIMEAGRDTEALYTTDTVTIHEIMGRNAGWLAAACGVAHEKPEDAPHLVYVPEIPVTLDKIAADVRRVLKELGGCVIAVSEGCVDPQGNYLAQTGGTFGKDAFGHVQLGGAAEFLGDFIEKKVRVKARRNKPGTLQRNGAHWASKTDRDEALLCGRAAVKLARRGVSGQMVTLVRESSSPYRCTIGTAPLAAVANGESKLPRDYLDGTGTHISEKFRDYLEPLLQGEVKVPVGTDGLPAYVRLKRKLVKQKCRKWNKA